MRFAEAWWLAGTAGALVLAALLIAGGVLLVRSLRRFGEDERVGEIVTDRAGGRRALKGVLLVVAVALAFVALAKPQYGRGTRRIPKTNLDVVVALDYSKSMYARDVTPSRIERAKAEVAQLIDELPGARFGAVAFAGEPLSFPLTSDGTAIAQFFRQLSPNDMPVGGTAIARALAASEQLLKRDPLSKKHRRVIVLVTDGEDLEGDPVSVAESAADIGITVHVVQIGGRTPEPIPAMDESGAMAGYRKNRQGEVLTTSLSAEGEKQLAAIASTTGGNVVRSAQGTTGISEITQSLSHMMTAELSERVETVYADVYMYPAGAAVLLLLLEAFVPEAKRRRRKKRKEEGEKAAEQEAPAAPTGSGRRSRRSSLGRASTAALLLFVIAGCTDVVDRVFTRHSPVVDDAIRALDAGDASAATNRLVEYLDTGHCKNGSLDTPEKVRELYNASLDLGLALFELGERYGAPFGQSMPPGATGLTGSDPAAQSSEIDCALSVVRLIATDRSVPFDVRARAHYLSGNLEFLRESYEDAVTAYDSALRLIPGTQADSGDGLGRRAAYNRAIALRRIEEQEEPDAGPPPKSDGGDDQSGDGGPPESRPDGGPPDPNGDGGGEPDPDRTQDGGGREPDPEDSKSRDGGGAPQPKQQKQEQQEQQEPPPQPSLSQDERMLDQLEHAPTLQQEAAKQSRRRVPFVGMEDK